MGDSSRPPLRRSTALVLAALGVVFAFACDDTGGLTGRTGLFNPATIDFGIQPVGRKVEQVTRLSSPGGADLIVEDVRFDPVVTAYSQRVVETGRTLRGSALPRAQGLDVKIIFDTDEPGTFDTRMFVVFSDGTEAPLTLKATSREVSDASLRINPSSITFPNTEVNSDSIIPIDVTNTGDVKGTINEVRPRKGRTSFSVTERGSVVPLRNVALDPGATLRADVHFNPTEPGMQNDTLEFVLSDGGLGLVEVQGPGVPAGELVCTSTVIDFGTIVRGGTASRPVRCTATGGYYTLERFRMGSMSSTLFTTVNAPTDGRMLAPDQSFDFTVQFVARGVPSEHRAWVDLDSARARPPTIIELRAKVAAPPITATRLHASLLWDTNLADLDLHLTRNGEEIYDPINDCYFRQKEQDWGQLNTLVDNPYLDRDDTVGTGPEEVSLSEARENEYDVYVHYYDLRPPEPSAFANVAIYVDGVKQLDLSRQMPYCGALWHVGKIRFDSVPPVITLDQVSDERLRARCEP